MSQARRILTLDANVFVSALKSDEPYSQKCAQILNTVPESFVLAEPSIVYQEVCGTIGKRAGADAAAKVEHELDRMIDPRLLSDCNREFCLSACPLCSQFNICSIDALYLRTALFRRSVFVSLDREDLVERIRPGLAQETEVYHVSDFPY